ncbi:hypothetical protein Agub_g5845 [Astrephomene gubernaculifera]|uniref:L-ascorbate peroxidase n=1 Tax=Astrephomene gubernaculifera TaxID=47775 RepID=A0AAD3HL36_9CHLO|nr:hypothetical protein Agub_g5845 [Astrephomene gubernaculifera]
MGSPAGAAVNVEQLRACKRELFDYINSRGCNPIMVRLAWHDSGTYNKEIAEWPARGGANASIRFKPEIDHGANSGLSVALTLLEPIKKKYPDVSYADLIQMASAVAIEAAGGPQIPLRYGRRDATGPEQCSPEGNLPGAAHPFPDGSPSPAAHLRAVFGRMGLTDRDIVALSGAHTLGRARPDRSGFGKEQTRYTAVGPGPSTASPRCAHSAKPRGFFGFSGCAAASGPPLRPVTPRPTGQTGQSWTVNWLEFDNSFFREVQKAKRDAELLVLPTDACLFEDEGFRPYAEQYAADQAAFFADYSESHRRLSELGVEWVAGGPVSI